MNDSAFNECRIFLQERMRELPDNTELVKAYVALIDHKTRFDTAFFSQNADVQKNWSDNQRELSKSWNSTHADVTKKQIEAGHFTPTAVGYNANNGVL